MSGINFYVKVCENRIHLDGSVSLSFEAYIENIRLFAAHSLILLPSSQAQYFSSALQDTSTIHLLLRSRVWCFFFLRAGSNEIKSQPPELGHILDFVLIFSSLILKIVAATTSGRCRPTMPNITGLFSSSASSFGNNSSRSNASSPHQRRDSITCPGLATTPPVTPNASTKPVLNVKAMLDCVNNSKKGASSGGGVCPCIPPLSAPK